MCSSLLERDHKQAQARKKQQEHRSGFLLGPGGGVGGGGGGLLRAWGLGFKLGVQEGCGIPRQLLFERRVSEGTLSEEKPFFAENLIVPKKNKKMPGTQASHMNPSKYRTLA